MRRGRLGRAARVALRAFPLLGVAMLLVLAAWLPWVPPVAGRVLVSAAYLPALAMLWLNHERPWVPVLLVGAALNCAVILANGGRMPISPAALADSGHALSRALLAGTDLRHVLAGQHSPLAFLGDGLAVRLGGFGLIVSPGDVLMAAGLAGFIQAAMCMAPDPDRTPS